MYSTTKMKSVDVKSSTYIDFTKKNNEKDPKFKINDIVIKTWKYFLQNWSKEVLVITKVKNTVPELMLLMILMENKLLKHFTEKNLKEQIKKILQFKN